MERISRGWLAVGALVALTAGVVLWQATSTAPTPLPAETAVDSTSEPVTRAEDKQSAAVPATESAEIVVHVAGAVKNPGVVRLPPGSRVDDAVKAAGGFSAQADPDLVNLAQPLEDGVQVYVPRKDEPVEVEKRVGAIEAGSLSTRTGTSRSERPADKVNLNTATAEQIENLPGIGPATARAIVEYRKQNGGFSSVDELIEVRGIGPKKLEQIRPFVTVR